MSSLEYAKGAPEDIQVRITVCNRGPEAATLHVLPTLWFRNTWSWPGGTDKPYLTAESDTGVFGGNSNWRGPVWFPVKVLIVRGLLNLFEIAHEIADRLSRIFLRDGQGCRPVYGATEKFQNDPYWRDYILFYEYFHGDNGAGIGASHQTGWTGLVAKTIQLFGLVDPADLLKAGVSAGFNQK